MTDKPQAADWPPAASASERYREEIGATVLAILDQEWNKAIEIAAKEVERHALALRSANGESEAWVWPAANSAIELAARVRRLKRSEYPKVDSDGLRMAAEEGHARVSSVVNVKSK